MSAGTPVAPTRSPFPLTGEWEPPEGDNLDLLKYAAVLWRWKWTLVLSMVLAGSAAFVISRLQKPVYEASTIMLVSQVPNGRMNDYTALMMSEQLTNTYAQMITHRPVLVETFNRLNMDPLELEIRVSATRGTQLLVITVEHENPRIAAVLANTLAEVFEEQNRERQQARAEELVVSNIMVVEKAEPAPDPIRPRVLMNTALATVVGAMLAFVFVFTWEAFRPGEEGAIE